MKLVQSIRQHITLPLAAFLVLACANGYAINAVQDKSREARDNLAVQTYKTQLAGCARTNDIRFTITSILSGVRTQVSESEARGELSPARAQLARAFYDGQLEKVRPIDCDRVYPKPDLG